MISLNNRKKLIKLKSELEEELDLEKERHLEEELKVKNLDLVLQ